MSNLSSFVAIGFRTLAWLQMVMTVVLNKTFVPHRLQGKLERHLRLAWASGRVAPSSLEVIWVHRDPGNLVVSIEMGEARLVKALPSDELEATALYLLADLEETLYRFQKENQS